MIRPASSARTQGSSRTPAKPAPKPLPAVDDRLVMPEIPWEIIDGKLYPTMPSSEPHGSQQVDLGSVLRSAAAPGYKVASEMLTRVEDDSDFAPDISVYPADPDPLTGGRKLEELAFEIVDKQGMSVSTRKAKKLVARGVRRIFCIKIRRAGREFLEWDRATNEFKALPEGAELVDRCLCLPIPVRALLSAAEADDVIAKALLARENPVLKSALQEVKDQGLQQGMAQGLEQGIAQGMAQGLEQGMAQGMAQGLEQGIAQGRLLEQRILLGQLLHQRYPAESNRIDAMVAGWEGPALTRIFGLLFEASSLDDLQARISRG